MNRLQLFELINIALPKIDEGIQLYWKSVQRRAIKSKEKQLLLSISRNMARLKTEMEFNGNITEEKEKCGHEFGYQIGNHWFCISCMKVIKLEELKWNLKM